MEETCRLNNLIDKPVVSMTDGAKVGLVKDVLIDTDILVATALLIVGDSGRGALPVEQIMSIGPDAITVEAGTDILWATSKSPHPGREAKEIIGLPIVNSTGKVIGNIHDIELTQHRISALEIRSGGVLGIGVKTIAIPASAIRGIGQKLITVDFEMTP